MTSFYEQNKFLIYGVSAVAVGVSLYLLTRDEEGLANQYDPKVHTLEKLQRIIDEIFIESATLYCQKLRLIREQKKEGQFKGKDSIQILVDKQQKEMIESEEDTYKEYKVTEQLVMMWLSKHQKDPYIEGKYNKLKEIHQMVFGSETGDGKIEHLQSYKIPTGMTEENYIKIFRKQQQIFRHEIYKAVKEVDRIPNPQEKEGKLKERYIETIKKKDDFQSEAMKLYGVSLQAGDDRPTALVLREVYLDFYSKSLKAQDTKPDTCSYSKKLQEEQKEHKDILDKIVMGQNIQAIKNTYEFGNGDPTVDPRLIKEEELTIKQQKLAGTYKEKVDDTNKFKLSADGMFVEDNNKDTDKKDEKKKEFDNEVKIAEQILKEEIEEAKNKKSQEQTDKKADPASGDAKKDAPAAAVDEKKSEPASADIKKDATPPAADQKMVEPLSTEVKKDAPPSAEVKKDTPPSAEVKKDSPQSAEVKKDAPSAAVDDKKKDEAPKAEVKKDGPPAARDEMKAAEPAKAETKIDAGASDKATPSKETVKK